MKNFNSLLMMALAVVLFSCEKENVTQESATPEANFGLGGEDDDGGSGDPTVDPFETTLHWVSFATMQTVYNNVDAREEFESNLGIDNTVKIEDLVGPASLNTEFNTEFRAIMYQYIDWELNGDPGTGGYQEHPPKPVDNDPPDPFGGDAVLSYLNHFIDVITQDNCIEIYLPEDLAYSDFGMSMTSTAHPLEDFEDGEMNEGLEYSYKPIEGSTTLYLYASLVDPVDDTYVTNVGNVIVARPFRLPPSPKADAPCQYVGYPADFTLFLD